jgi:hypothetical protein
MATPPLAPPSLGLDIGPLIVSQGMAVEQGAQLLGVGGLAQPDERLDMQLMDALLGETEGCADAAKGRGGIVAQAIVGHDNDPQVVREACHQVMDSGLNGRDLAGADRVNVLRGSRG